MEIQEIIKRFSGGYVCGNISTIEVNKYLQELIELQSTITGKDAEILRLQNRLLVATHSKNADEFDWNTLDEIHKLRSLLKEVKEDAELWYSQQCRPCFDLQTCCDMEDRHRTIMEKLKQEGVE
jgi:hypothetical protein